MEDVKIEQLTEAQITAMKIYEWPVWTKEVSRFDWTYSATEQCLILEGEVEVKTKQHTYHIKAGDFVTFRNGLQCEWNVIKPIRKHYNFK